jgi:hypothetical protein
MDEERLLHLHFHCLMGWYTRVYMNQSDDSLEEKKLLVSGGHAFAKLTEHEELKANLGLPQIFLENVRRLDEERFTKYYCNKCQKATPRQQ